ncbi:uncharacterized protein LOC108807521 [Raphanus sativus]|uniref:Uncharacterized protein LOC108807521 n=1 Tax=Raphanus sativus TaxID=3726 RepID=A0A6J0JI47_RAPSA|nr:uncharacterized protein LOC108807521 [Raphanus sativus]
MGRIGMRDIQRFNQALFAKLAWRITTVPNCLLARVLKGKYCHKKNFLEVELPSSCSHGWRSVLHGRNLLREHLGKAIGNSQSTRVWKDSWISLDTDIKPFRPVQIDALDLRVSDLLTDDLKWNTQRINDFLPQLSEQIHLLRPSSLGTEDIFVWQPLQSGIYTTKSGYRASLQAPRVPPSLPNSITNASEFSWVKDIWNSQCSPKLRVFLWSIVRRAIPVGENLRSRGILSNANCCRCGSLETPVHLFFQCSFAQKVWDQTPLANAIPIATTDDFKAVMIKFRNATCLPPSGISSTILPWICWAIWTAKNRLIFEGKSQTASEVMLRGLIAAREWIQAQAHRQPIKLPALPAPQGKHADRRRAGATCFTDASWDSTSKKAGIAWIITESTETPPRESSLSIANVASPLMAEAIAIRSGILAAADLDITNISFFSDCQTLIRAINNKLHIKELFGIISDIKQLSSAFVSISFCFIPRPENCKADELAKRALRFRVLFV